MIRIRFYGTGELIQRYFRAARRLITLRKDCVYNARQMMWALSAWRWSCCVRARGGFNPQICRSCCELRASVRGDQVV